MNLRNSPSASCLARIRFIPRAFDCDTDPLLGTGGPFRQSALYSNSSARIYDGHFCELCSNNNQFTPLLLRYLPAMDDIAQLRVSI
jgi:hypothetical protein